MSAKTYRPSLLSESDHYENDPLKGPQYYTATTEEVTVTVRTFWLEDQSDPEEQRYAWIYHIVIENSGKEAIQLLSRSWTLINAVGHIEQTHGEGVMGEQPIIDAQSRYEYTSGAEFKTPTGLMKGIFHMIVPQSQNHFDVTIPTFSLDSPHHPIGLLN